MTFKKNRRNKGDGLKLLGTLKSSSVSLVILDPQYRGLLDKMSYGNEGEEKMKARISLPQMDNDVIWSFIDEVGRVLSPSGHLFMWVDKFALCEGTWAKVHKRLDLGLHMVDLITWEKPRIGMGYRTRRKCEYLLVFQKVPLRAKGVWVDHGIPDVWSESSYPHAAKHPHRKPILLQTKLIKSVTRRGDLVVDPAAGSYSVMLAAAEAGRDFLGCDIRG